MSQPRDYASYLRVSSDQQREDETIESQRESHISYYRANGIDPDTDVYWFVDDGVRGRIYFFDRPSGKQLKAYIEKGYIRKAVIAWNVNRLSRQDVMSYFALEALCEDHGLPLLTIQDKVDTSTEAGQIWGGINALFSRKHINEQVETMVEGRKAKAAKGRFQGGRIPFGFTRNPETLALEINPHEANLIYLGERLIHEGYGYRRLATYCIENKIPPPRGQEQWNFAWWRRVLNNPALYGEARYHTTRMTRKGGKVKQLPRPKDEHIIVRCPAILSKARWQRMMERIKNRTLIPTYEGVPPTLLDCIYCKHCGQRYYNEIRADRANLKPGYKHRNPSPCKYSAKTLRAWRVDDYVWSRILAYANDLDAFRDAIMSDTEPSNGHEVEIAERALQEALEGEKRMNKLINEFVTGGKPLPEAFLSLPEEVAARISLARARLQEAQYKAGDTARREERLQELTAYLQSKQALLTTLTHAQKRTFCAALLRRVTINHHYKRRPDLMVHIEWAL